MLVSADGDNETRIRQHANAVAAAKRAGVGFHCVHQSSEGSRKHQFVRSDASGDGKVGWALQQDYAAAVLAGTGHENTIYELSGKPLTQEEIAAAFGTVLDKKVSVL